MEDWQTSAWHFFPTKWKNHSLAQAQSTTKSTHPPFTKVFIRSEATSPDWPMQPEYFENSPSKRQ
jgi:hypothetical protein